MGGDYSGLQWNRCYYLQWGSVVNNKRHDVLMAARNASYNSKVNSGSASSRKNTFKSPAMVCTLSMVSKSTFLPDIQIKKCSDRIEQAIDPVRYAIGSESEGIGQRNGCLCVRNRTFVIFRLEFLDFNGRSWDSKDSFFAKSLKLGKLREEVSERQKYDLWLYRIGERHQ
jgi:hypothetical protein